MAKPVGRLLSETPKALVDKGPSHIAEVGCRYLRGRLPEELWTGLCRDPMARADDVIELFDGGSITVAYDGRYDLPRRLDAYNRRITGAEGNLYVFEDCSLFGRRPVVETDGLYFSASWFGVDMPYYDQRFKRVQRNLPLLENIRQTRFDSEPDETIEYGFLLDTERGNGFHHWFFEVLPKLYWFEQLRERTDTLPKLITHSPLAEYQRQSLARMGYDADMVIEHPHQHTAVERLLIPPHPIRLLANQYNSLPTQLKWVGDRLTADIDTSATEFSDRIYVSRADADRRLVVNETEIVDKLEAYGFESYEPGRYSVDEQMEMFHNADIIVGPHGLAYTNLLYAADATVVECFPEGGATATYFVAATELDLEYECLEGPTADDGIHIRDRDKNFTISPEQLIEIIEAVVARTAPASET